MSRVQVVYRSTPVDQAAPTAPPSDDSHGRPTDGPPALRRIGAALTAVGLGIAVVVAFALGVPGTGDGGPEGTEPPPELTRVVGPTTIRTGGAGRALGAEHVVRAGSPQRLAHPPRPAPRVNPLRHADRSRSRLPAPELRSRPVLRGRGAPPRRPQRNRRSPRDGGDLHHAPGAVDAAFPDRWRSTC